MSKLDKQTAKLIGRIAENLPEMDGDIMQGWIDNPKGLQKFLRGLCPPEVTAPKEETPLDTIIHIDRSANLVYPEGEVLHPELKSVGPNDYDLSKDVELWLHPDQKNGGVVTGYFVYDHLKVHDMLKTCLGLQDALAIQAKGLATFRKIFGNKPVFCWKSVVRRRDDRLCVPYFSGGGSSVLMGWLRLDNDWKDYDPAARFASSILT